MNKLIFFKNNDCIKCNLLAKEMDKIKKEEEDIEIYTLSTNDKDKDKYCQYFGIMSVPVVILINSENIELDRFYGYKCKEYIVDFWKEYK